MKSECHAITNRYPEAASVLQQVYKALSDIEDLAGCTMAEVGESSEWAFVINRANYCKALGGKLLFNAFYAMYAVTVN
jgi:hypothetical protein